MRGGHVVVGLHLQQAGCGALELEGGVAGGVQVHRLGVGGADQLAARLVERIDEMDETPRLVAVVRPELRDAVEDQGVEAPGQRQVVGGAQCPGAEILEAGEGDA